MATLTDKLLCLIRPSSTSNKTTEAMSNQKPEHSLDGFVAVSMPFIAVKAEVDQRYWYTFDGGSSENQGQNILSTAREMLTSPRSVV